MQFEENAFCTIFVICFEVEKMSIFYSFLYWIYLYFRRPLKGTGYGIRIRVKYTWFKIKNYVTCIVILAKKKYQQQQPAVTKNPEQNNNEPPPPSKSASWSIRHIIKGFTFPLVQHRWTIEKTALEVIPQALKEEKRYGKQGLTLY